MLSWKGEGAITELRSAPYKVRLRPVFWLSAARLHPDFDETFGGKFAVPLWSVGWGRSKAESESESRKQALLAQARKISGLSANDAASGVGWAPDSERALRDAFHEALASWSLTQVEQSSITGIQRREDLLRQLPERDLFHGELASLKLYLSRPTHCSAVAIVTSPSMEFGIHISAGAGENELEALQKAMRSLFLLKRKFDRCLTGKEQLLDRLEDQHMFLNGISGERCEALEQSLREGCDLKSRFEPKVLLCCELIGEWSTRFRLARVVLAKGDS